MRLWTFQSREVANVLRSGLIYRADYSSTARAASREYFEWMARQMELRGIFCEGHPPIWAWRPGGTTGRAPRLTTAQALLSDAQLTRGVEIIEFDAPENAVLMSSYTHWCEIYFEPTENLPAIPPPQLFEVNLSADNDDIQACLPFVRREWVIAIRPLHLKPGDEVDNQRCI